MIIKAVFPLFRYDGEPSVSNGIMYQLPSSHLFIHRVPAKLSYRVYALGGFSCRLQLLFVLDYFLTWSVPHSTDFVDAPLCLPFAGLLLTGIICPVSFGFRSRTLLSSRCFWNSAGFWNPSFLVVYATAVCTVSGYRISFSSFSESYGFPVFSIV